MHGNMTQRLIREIRILREEPWLMALAVWLPPLLFALFWWIFIAGSSFDLAIGVVDLDHSRLSRALTRQCDASSIMAVEQQFPSVIEGRQALTGADIYALMVIPDNFEKDVYLGLQPQPTVFYNGQFILIGKQINGAMLQAVGLLAGQIDGLQAMATGTALPAVVGQVAPIRGQITPLFNKHTNYAEFLVSGGIPAIWQIMIVMVTVLSLAAEKRHGGLSRWSEGSHFQALASKLLPYTLILWLQGIVFLVGMYGWLGWPMNGNWTALILAQLLTVLAGQAMGSLFFLLSLDAARGLSLAAAYTAPSFAFMGVTFPATDMGMPALIWRSLLPVTHYIKVQIQLANYGVNPWVLWSSFAALLLFVLPLLLALKKMANIPEVEPDLQGSGEVSA
jgi:ABC-2 type transport system permease protein